MSLSGKAEHFLSSMAVTAVSADDNLPRWRELRGTVTINGEAVARPHTAGSRFGLGDTLELDRPGVGRISHQIK